MRVVCQVSLVLSISCALWGCTSSVKKQIRIAPAPNDIVDTSISSLKKDTKARVAAAGSTVERHRDPEVPDGDFDLAVVEFSDDGVAWSKDQRKLVLKTLVDDMKANGAIVVAFIHGWRHNATACDDNVACFRRVLQTFARRERQLNGDHARRIVGIYLGWRGLSSCSEPFTTTSIFGRKHIGETLGTRAGREVLRQIMMAVGEAKREHPELHSRLIIAGHSLGAGVVFSAVGPLFLQRLHDAIPPEGSHAPLTRIGELDLDASGVPVPLPDLVLLLNPAFEAQLYKPLQRNLSYLLANHIPFAADQPPIMLTISSPHDSATKGIFFLGQFLEVLVTPTMWFHGPAYIVRYVVTPPHLSSYITDRAVLLDTLPSRKGSENGASCFSGDPFVDASKVHACDCAELTPDRLLSVMTSTASFSAPDKSAAPAVKNSYGPVRLEHLRGDVNNPFLVVTAGDLIRDHDDIYNATLLAFVTNLIGRVDTQKTLEGR